MMFCLMSLVCRGLGFGGGLGWNGIRSMRRERPRFLASLGPVGMESSILSSFHSMGGGIRFKLNAIDDDNQIQSNLSACELVIGIV